MFDFNKASLADKYQNVRKQTELLCAPLSIEDCVVQSMPDASPIKWHLAHTTWFFETFFLSKVNKTTDIPTVYGYLFNSYYQAVGPQFPRARRGTLSRPTMKEVWGWRRQVDESIASLLEKGIIDTPELLTVLEIGLHHEMQHQELMVIDVKNALMQTSLAPKLGLELPRSLAPDVSFCKYAGGLVQIGHSQPDSFCYDNEQPLHKTYIEPFELRRSVVTCGEYLEFMEDGGYKQPNLWLSDGWYWLSQTGYSTPLYWEKHNSRWMEKTLSGPRDLDLNAPVTHISYFEADAFARWAGYRLPTEAEWEHAAEISRSTIGGVVLEDKYLHPLGQIAKDTTHAIPNIRMFGDVWEWTSSAYMPYPGFKPNPGALGEYNGKFMNNQYVLRGGSAATPKADVRATYRNFFGPSKRWVFTGIRLANS